MTDGTRLLENFRDQIDIYVSFIPDSDREIQIEFSEEVPDLKYTAEDLALYLHDILDFVVEIESSETEYITKSSIIVEIDPTDKEHILETVISAIESAPEKVFLQDVYGNEEDELYDTDEDDWE